MSRIVIALVAVVLAGCSAGTSGTPAATTGTITDAARAWCRDPANGPALGSATVSLGIDKEMAKVVVTGSDNGTAWADYILTQPVRGIDAQNQPYAEQLYRQEITEWEAQSPATFSRACLAAFGGR